MKEELDHHTGEKYIGLSEDEIKIGFLAECVERLAEIEGASYIDMLDRMEKADMTKGYILKYYDSIHTQSWESVMADLQEMLHHYESSK